MHVTDEEKRPKASHKTSTSSSIHGGRRGREKGSWRESGEGEGERRLQALNPLRMGMRERREKTLQGRQMDGVTFA